MTLQPVSSPEPRFQRIDDVEQACRLREAGLLWRFTGLSYYYLVDSTWDSLSILYKWAEATRYGAGFYILLED